MDLFENGFELEHIWRILWTHIYQSLVSYCSYYIFHKAYQRLLDKIESLDNIKKRKSTNVPEKTIGGLSQWFPLAFLLMVAYARSSLIRLSSFISRQSRHLGITFFTDITLDLSSKPKTYSLMLLSYALVPMLRNIRSAGAKIRSLEFFQNLPMKSWLLIGWISNPYT